MQRLALVTGHIGLVVVLAAGCAKSPATAVLPSASTPDLRVSATPVERVLDTGTARPLDGGGGSATGQNAGGLGASGQPLTPGRFEPHGFVVDANMKDIYFEFDRYDIRPADMKSLDASAAYLKAKPSLLVIVEGNTDERGTNEYNMALGERRARAAISYLVSRGIPANRMSLVSYGEERPVCGERSESCWAKNRRAHFLVKAQ